MRLTQVKPKFEVDEIVLAAHDFSLAGLRLPPIPKGHRLVVARIDEVIPGRFWYQVENTEGEATFEVEEFELEKEESKEE